MSNNPKKPTTPAPKNIPPGYPKIVFMPPTPPTTLNLLQDAQLCELLEWRIQETATNFYGPPAAGYAYTVVITHRFHPDGLAHVSTARLLNQRRTAPSPSGARGDDDYEIEVLARAQGTPRIARWLRRSEAMEALLLCLEREFAMKFGGSKGWAGPAKPEKGKVAGRVPNAGIQNLRETVEGVEGAMKDIKEALEDLNVAAGDMKEVLQEVTAVREKKGKGKAEVASEGKGKAKAGNEEKPKPADSQ
ncbi:uncharacterized protein BDZ99DRAFT_567603 [Mytilinidion resinicola]|uniref:Uncharacterized protein n=1 Tax=Mytilinidion resinicola TaxID=574789 RepID=A0A6A6YY63_9PEZI|nr:uncharacterized protein BDZ99DRAFT_567603 [Mytilinidion resinicola]KAF2813886.1 hypothetical protein BDZ99DRAFT_567603 [Mytilinidion resinicola]